MLKAYKRKAIFRWASSKWKTFSATNLGEKEKQNADWKKIFANHIPDKRLKNHQLKNPIRK